MDTLNKGFRLPWWGWVVGIDLFLIVASILDAQLVPYLGNFANPFFLADEMNLATWWSGITLLTLAFLAYELACTRTDGTKGAWLILFMLWIGLSWDEIGSFHERIEAFLDKRIFVSSAVVLTLLFLLASIILISKQETRKTALGIIGGFLIMGIATSLNYVEHLHPLLASTSNIWVGLEEGAELLGMLLCLVAITPLRVQADSHQITSVQINGVETDKIRLTLPITWKQVIPNPYQMRYIPLVVLGGFDLHLVVSIVFARYFAIEQSGNPAIWFPLALFTLLFYAALWKSWSVDERKHTIWFILSIYFVLSSIGILLLHDVQSQTYLLGFLGSFSNFYGQFAVQAILLSLFCFWLYGGLSWKSGLALLVLSLLVLGGFWLNSPILQYMAAGISAFFISTVFLMGNTLKNPTPPLNFGIEQESGPLLANKSQEP